MMQETLRNVRVLVVDSYPDLADTVCELITTFGHECRIARCAEAALAEVDAFDPEIAIVALSLPGVGGYALAHALRARCPGRALYVVALTGWPDEPSDVVAAGFDHHVFKPFDGRALWKTLELAKRQLALS